MSLSHLDSKVTVEVENLGREFESKQGKDVALDAVSLNAREGEIFGVLGPNGAGKTTMIRILMQIRSVSLASQAPSFRNLEEPRGLRVPT